MVTKKEFFTEIINYIKDNLPNEIANYIEGNPILGGNGIRLKDTKIYIFIKDNEITIDYGHDWWGDKKEKISLGDPTGFQYLIELLSKLLKEEGFGIRQYL